MAKIEKHEGIKAGVREGIHNYVYEFSPPLDPKLTNIPRRITNIIQKELVSRGGGFALQNVIQKKVYASASGEGPMERDATALAAELNIPRTTPLHIVEHLFSVMREEGFDIGITIEHYPKTKDINPIRGISKEVSKNIKEV